jgi:3-oxoacyl-ACP reductase-like protein
MLKKEKNVGYRAIVHYHFKKGLEEEGILFLERELMKKAQQMGCHGIEIWQNEKAQTYVIGIGHWKSIEEARRFQDKWNAKEKELLRFCTNVPEREFYEFRSAFTQRATTPAKARVRHSLKAHAKRRTKTKAHTRARMRHAA